MGTVKFLGTLLRSLQLHVHNSVLNFIQGQCGYNQWYFLQERLVCGHEDEELFGKVMDLIVTPAQECLFVLSLLIH